MNRIHQFSFSVKFRVLNIGTNYMVEPLSRTEQDYLDLAQTFKDRMDEKDSEQRETKEKYMDGRKYACVIYGLIRTLQREMDSEFHDQILVDWLIAEIRSISSDLLFKNEEDKLGIYGY